MKSSLLALLYAALPISAIAQVVEPAMPKAPEPIESILRLQLFLDGKLFGPGKVDGRPGEFTTKALKRYQKAALHVGQRRWAGRYGGVGRQQQQQGNRLRSSVHGTLGTPYLP